jgi:hypothetical protein
VISSFFFLKQLISYAIVPRWRATRKRMYGVDRADFSGKPAYQSLANDHIELPMRICVGDELKGRLLGIQYSLFAQNLRTPAKGKIRLLF